MSPSRGALLLALVALAQARAVRAGAPNALVPTVAVIALILAATWRWIVPRYQGWRRGHAVSPAPVTSTIGSLLDRESPARAAIVVSTGASPSLLSPPRFTVVPSPRTDITALRDGDMLTLALRSDELPGSLDAVLAELRARLAHARVDLAAILVDGARMDKVRDALFATCDRCHKAGVRAQIQVMLPLLRPDEIEALKHLGWFNTHPPRAAELTLERWRSSLGAIRGGQATSAPSITAQQRLPWMLHRICEALSQFEAIRSELHNRYPWLTEGSKSFLLDPIVTPAGPASTDLVNSWGATLAPTEARADWSDDDRFARRALRGRGPLAMAAAFVAALLLVDAAHALHVSSHIARRSHHAARVGAVPADPRALVHLATATDLLARLGGPRPIGWLVRFHARATLRVSFAEVYNRAVMTPAATAMRALAVRCAGNAPAGPMDCLRAMAFVRLVTHMAHARLDDDPVARRNAATTLAQHHLDTLRAAGTRSPPRAMLWRAAATYLRVYGEDAALRPSVAALDARDEVRGLDLNAVLDAHLDDIEREVSQVYRDEVERELQGQSEPFTLHALPRAAYTEHAFHAVVSRAIEQRADEIAARPWMLPTSLAPRLSAADLRTQMTRRFFARYELAWRRFVGAVQLRATADEGETLRQVEALVDPVVSPFERLLCVVDAQSRPSEARPPGGGVLGRIEATFWPRSVQRALVVDTVDAEHLRNAFAPVVALGLISDRAQPPCSTAELQSSSTTRLRRHLARLTEIHARWSQAREGHADEVHAQIAEARQSLMNSIGSDALARSVSPLLEEPLIRLDGHLLVLRATATTRRYCDSILARFEDARAQYPFASDPNASALGIGSLRELFASDQGVPGLVGQLGGTATIARSAHTFDQRFTRFARDAEGLRLAFSTPSSVRVTVDASGVSSDVRYVEFNLGNATVLCDRGADALMRCGRPVAGRVPDENNPNVRLALWRNAQTEPPCAEFNEDGDWAIFRLMERGRHRRADDGQIEATVETSCGRVTLRVRPTGGVERLFGRAPSAAPFAPLRSLRPPSRIFRTGDACD